MLLLADAEDLRVDLHRVNRSCALGEGERHIGAAPRPHDEHPIEWMAGGEQLIGPEVERLDLAPRLDGGRGLVGYPVDVDPDPR